MQADRNLLIGVTEGAGRAVLAVVVLLGLLLVWALTGVRSAERAG